MTRELRPKRFTLKLLLLWVSFIQVNILLPNIFEFFPIIIEAWLCNSINENTESSSDFTLVMASLMLWYYAKRFYVHPKRRPFPNNALACILYRRIKIQKITKCRIIISTDQPRFLKAESFYYDVNKTVIEMMTFRYFIIITSCYCVI